MKSILWFVIAGLLSCSLYSQEPSVPSSDESYFIAVENFPEPIGGMAAIQAKIIYPEIARRAGIQGTVYVEVFIDERGGVVKANVKQGIGAGCDEAAITAVRQTRFRPGTQQGKPVKVRLAIPIRFRLAEKDTIRKPVSKAELSQEEYKGLMKFLGMRIGRFQYSIPYHHKLEISFVTYQHGQEKTARSFISATQPAGDYTWSVVLWEEQEIVRLGLQQGSGGAKVTVPFKIIGPLYHHAMVIPTMAEKEAIPVYVFVSHPIIVPELNGTESMKEIIETYDQVLFIKVQNIRR